MNILAVDDERIQLEELEEAIKNAVPDAMVTSFRKPKEALDYAKHLKTENKHINLAFLNIEMSVMNGLELAKELKNVYDMTNIVFVTGYSQYAVDAFSVPACDYILKPVSKERVLEALERLRNPIIKNEKRLRVQCFGNFDVFVDDKPLRFPRSKAKEIFAYLVSKNGARCSNNEIIAVIWENKDDSESLKSQFRQIVADLNHALKTAGLNDILIKEHGYLAVAPDKFSCDMYDFIKTGNNTVNNYKGKFMMQYSWAEFIIN